MKNLKTLTCDNDMNTISVIVPAYNSERTLKETVGSILNQTHTELDIVLVDDGSQDNTAAMADFLCADHSEIVAVHTVNQGVSLARMMGVKASSGEWIGFVDSDDWIEPDMYRHLLQNAIQYGTDISHCGYRTIVNGGERVHFFYNTGRLIRQDRRAGLKDLLEGSFIEPGLCNKLFHKTLFHSLLHRCKSLDGIRINEDLLVNYYLFKEAKASVYEDFCPYYYMAVSTSATRSSFQLYKVLDPLKVNKTILDDVNPSLKDYAWKRYLGCCIGALSALHRKKDYLEERKRIKQIALSNRDKWHLLNSISRYKLCALLYVPWLYLRVYRFYEKFLQKKIYE